jgi:hypothetical protein
MKPELEDLLQHHGVKGMHWGKRLKTKYENVRDHGRAIKERGKHDKEIMRKVRNKEMTRKEGKEERWKSFHKLHLTNATYKQVYEKHIAKGTHPKKAMRRAYQASQRKKQLALNIGGPIAKAAISRGKDILGN